VKNTNYGWSAGKTCNDGKTEANHKPGRPSEVGVKRCVFHIVEITLQQGLCILDNIKNAIASY
jgi:hypothetical protein